MANLKDKVSTFCLPAKIYLVLAVISIIVGFVTGATLIFVFVKLVFAILWTLLLNFLCSSGLTPLSWFLVLLPYIFILLAFIILLTTSVANKVGQINTGILNGVQTGATQLNHQVRHNVQPIVPQYQRQY
jgi:hypothetical protein